jgi:hypothetical protein
MVGEVRVVCTRRNDSEVKEVQGDRRGRGGRRW